ncbi:uncharacterized protein LOC111371959 [Olea europaea var. sylvestris]|uniref:uncharacterized protein LOC111371959 n=1 Tax=Olea europaea var. sylvestris TaxID=158386 RepID=UPI000C1D6123|nr:uncharacterized protein LOC111371959 [Olea europaea var. sylvestris]
MLPADEERASFITDRGLYCYRMMPFELKNVGAAYQRLVNKIFMDLIGKTMEVYVDDMLVKRMEAEDYITHLNSTFQILRRYRMRLNPLKCTFGVASGKFLGYMVNQREIEANLEKIEALYKMRSPQKPKEVQSLTGRVAALSCFVSKTTDKCLPFFKVLKAGKKFQWNEECEEPFQGLKRHLGQAPLLSKLKPEEILQLYLVVSNEAISSVLTREEGTAQLPVYYTRRLLKWAVELSEFDLIFKARAAIKGQALADFVAEFTNLPDVDEIMEPAEPPTWNLFVDRSAEDADSSVGVVLISPEGHKLNSAVMFGFKATNNVAEYEALLAGLRLAKEMQVKRLLISSDSQLVVSQGNGNFLAKDKTMASYLKIVMNLIPSFEKFELIQIPCIENSHADALSKLTSSKDSELLTVLSTDKLEASKLRRRSAHFLFIDDVLFKRSFSSPLLRCVGGEEANYILREAHEGVCSNHSGGLSLAQKILRQGHYWHTLKRDALQFDLTAVSSPWPFSKWGVDLIRPLPKGRGGASFAIVAIDYFTKWVEVEPLAKITEANTSKFLWKNIMCRFGIPYSIVSDNDREFDNKKVRELYEELGIKKHFFTPHHSQANSQVEAVNKTIKHVLKIKLDMSKGA